MSNQSDGNVVKRSVVGRALRGLISLFIFYVTFFVFLVIDDSYYFQGKLFWVPFTTCFPEWEKPMEQVIRVVYLPLLMIWDAVASLI